MKKTTSPSSIQKFSLPILILIFFGVYILGTLFPDYWWTTHWLAFSSPVVKYGLLVLAGICMMYPVVNPRGISIPKIAEKIPKSAGRWIIIGVGLIMGFLFYHFPIYFDYFGDAYKVIDQLNESIAAIPKGANEAFFKFGLSPWDGHMTILSIVTYIAYFSGMTYEESFLWLDVVCGVLFVWAWLFFIRFYLKDNTWKIIMGLAGISAPFMLIFFGHNESYAPVFLCFMVWMMGLLMYTQNPNPRLLWGLVLLLLLCIKLHPVALLFGISLGLAFLHQYKGSSSLNARLSNWKGIGIWVLAPIFIAGAVLYFFVFEDHKDQRILDTMVKEFDRLFLPIFSPDPPHEKYNLLSFNHIFDFFSEMLLWSPVALFLMVAILISGFKKIPWNSPPIMWSGIVLILFGSLFFMINPLLSMQLDWDLFALPGVIFLVFVVAVVKELEGSGLLLNLKGKILPVATGLVLLCIPSFLIHNSVDTISQRYESLGIRKYHTYYEWSSKVIQVSLDLPAYQDRREYELRKNEVMKKLKPHSVKGIDFVYARLLSTEAKYYLRTARDYDKGMALIKEAERYFPEEKNVILYLMEAHFLQGKYKEAFDYSMKLIEISYPNEKKAISIALQCSLEAGLYQEALPLSEYYLTNWNDRPLIKEINARLLANDNRDSLKYLFSR